MDDDEAHGIMEFAAIILPQRALRGLADRRRDPLSRSMAAQ